MQDSLFPKAPDDGATHRLFFALMPDAPAREGIAEVVAMLREAHGVRARAIDVGRLHMTVLFLGDFARPVEREIEALRRAADRVAMKPFDVVFDRVASFHGKPGAHPCVLRREHVDPEPVALRDALWREVVAEGLRPARAKPLVPHVTLLYDAQMVPMREIAPVAWSARDVVLIDNVRRPGTQRGEYVVLGRWPFLEV